MNVTCAHGKTWDTANQATDQCPKCVVAIMLGQDIGFTVNPMEPVDNGEAVTLG